MKSFNYLEITQLVMPSQKCGQNQKGHTVVHYARIGIPALTNANVRLGEAYGNNEAGIGESIIAKMNPCRLLMFYRAD